LSLRLKLDVPQARRGKQTPRRYGRAHRPWRRVSRIISRAGYDFDDLLAKAKTKDLGLQPFFMAGSLLQVRQFQHLPNTMPPLALPELQAFIISLTDRLLDQSRPPENSL